MATRIIRTERRRRGFFGWLFLLVFLAFNLLMLLSVIAGLNAVSEGMAPATEAEKAGAAIGTAIGISMLLGIWAMCAFILGLFVLLTRGAKTVIETTEG
jgi:uncharacterized membrane protein